MISIRKVSVPIFFALGSLWTGAASAALIHAFDFTGPGINDTAGTATGTLLGGATLSGGALVLNGTSAYVQMDSFLIPGGNSDFTIIINAKADAWANTYAQLVSQGYSGGPGFYIGKDQFDMGLRLGDQLQSTGVNVPSAGLSHTYALTSDGTNARYYLDSELVKVFDVQLNIPTSGTATRFGAQFDQNFDRGPYGEYFNGSIYDIRIFDTALSEGEVADLAQISAVPLPAALPLLASAFGLMGFVGWRRKQAR